MSAITHEARFRGLETRVTATEENIAALTDSVYDTQRRVIGLELNMAALMDHFGLPKASDDDIDTVLDAQ